MSCLRQRCSSGRVDRWLVAIGCCLVTFVIHGVARSNGIIYVTLIDTFGVGRKEAVLPFVLRSVFRNLNGPFIGALSYYLSLRIITIVGLLLITLANALCFFARDIVYVTVVLGVIQGSGIGMAMILMPMVIRQHFSKYRTTALGLAYAGGTVGGFALPPLVAFIIDDYGLRGGFLVIGGIILHGLIGASLMRNPRPKFSKKTALSTVEVPDKVGPEDNVPIRGTPLYRKGTNSSNDAHGVLLPPSVDEEDIKKSSGDGIRRRKSLVVGEPPAGKKLPTLVSKLRENCWTAASVLKDPDFLLVALNSTVFVGSFITFLTVIVDFASDNGVERIDGVFLISLFAIADFFGKLGCGWLTDRGVVKLRTLYGANIFTLGTALMVLPSVPGGYSKMAVLAIFIGASVGMKLTVLPALTEDIVGLEKLPMALGLKNFFHGFTIVVVLQMAGYIRDILGSYDHAFHILGGACLACSVLWFLRPLAPGWKRKYGRTECDGHTEDKENCTENS